MKKGTITFLSFFIPTLIFGQIKTESFYYDSTWKKCDSLSAKYISTYTYTDSIAKSGAIRTVDNNGQIKSDCEYSDLEQKKRDGTCKFFHDNGELKSKEQYKNGKYHGELTTYYSSGQLKRRDIYDNGELKNGQCFTSTGHDTTYYIYEVVPQYPGGTSELYKFISANLAYPKEAHKKGITGKVVVRFTVAKDGLITSAAVDKSVHPLLDEEALRVVNLMGKWIPGVQDGEKVAVKYILPINFKLQ